jgi:hypothetical protein
VKRNLLTNVIEEKNKCVWAVCGHLIDFFAHRNSSERKADLTEEKKQNLQRDAKKAWAFSVKTCLQ